ncbi:hypothetical protein SAMN05192558_10799 [Actinokineospora alba]|uniref:Uncharacterized protein n=1 Tax=Actinokineospora alba TaxID=504798 RepID=A0A1H0QQG7_9PSEU|nr:hypothetical protein [Actinokineospora alba]TDP70442.1 hypothetical protein C8E96_6052 [Actinokineospora alba]SDI31523.1 hypothetical protein SAMN05421871_10498 [Actinokineospora alba]SDP19512.1 hypothetical protein SAMN05192558_10799 [Actinokineospora alba]
MEPLLYFGPGNRRRRLVLRPRYAVTGATDPAETFTRLVGSVAIAMLRREAGISAQSRTVFAGKDGALR